MRYRDIYFKIDIKVQDYKWSSYKKYIKGNRIVKREFILGFLSNKEKRAIKIYSEFMKEENKDECLEIKDKLKISDDEARKIIHEYFKVQKMIRHFLILNIGIKYNGGRYSEYLIIQPTNHKCRQKI